MDRFWKRQTPPNRWKGFIVGAAGGIAGVLAMQLYWQVVSAAAGSDPRKMQKRQPTPEPLKALDSISLVGRQYLPGELSTAALGRILYHKLAGQQPESQETRTVLSYVIHWVISLGMSGVYGTLRKGADVPDIEGGLMLGTGLWLLGDELLMPLAGLTGGPTSYPAVVHLHSWIAHLAYGLASSAVAQVLDEVTADLS